MHMSSVISIAKAERGLRRASYGLLLDELLTNVLYNP